MVYVSASADVDLFHVLDSMNSAELIELASDLLNEGHVPDGWVHVDDLEAERSVNLSDSAVLIDVIVELRRMGYTVEPGGK